MEEGKIVLGTSTKLKSQIILRGGLMKQIEIKDVEALDVDELQDEEDQVIKYLQGKLSKKDVEILHYLSEVQRALTLLET